MNFYIISIKSSSFNVVVLFGAQNIISKYTRCGDGGKIMVYTATFNKYSSYIVAVTFIGVGKMSTRIKLYRRMLYQVHVTMKGIRTHNVRNVLTHYNQICHLLPFNDMLRSARNTLSVLYHISSYLLCHVVISA